MSDTVTGGTNHTVPVLERLIARGERDALVQEGRRIGGAEAARTALRFAAGLRARGVGEGDGVGLFVDNTPEALLLQLAVHFVGARMVFVLPEPGDAELEALVRDSEVALLVFDPVFEERARRIVGEVPVPQVCGLGPSALADDFLAETADLAPLPLAEAADDRLLATVLYTGGTTGRPKLVVHRRRYYQGFLKLAGAFTDTESPDPTLLICTLVTHTTGHIAFLLCTLSGHTVVLQRSFDAGAALDTMEREGVTRMMTVAPMIYELLDHPGCRPGRFPALRTLHYTGAAASPARLRQAVERFGPVLSQFYGVSECGSISALLPHEHDLDRPESLTSCGRPGPGVEVEPRDERGRPVPVGQPGEFHVRSLSVMEEYWNDPARTAEVLDADGWFRTGDIGRVDADGYLYLMDRARDIVVTGVGADNVYSRLLDDFLAAHPAVREAATVGLPGRDDREAVHVVLVPLNPARTPDLDLLGHEITAALGDLYTPVSYSFADALPRTALGKTDKRAVRAGVLTGRDAVRVPSQKRV
ncbi:AMP-binding protein [Streptomyces sp. J2-1]|uniref:AMP-binding protein n=1 Tax=Streptomyces corallincola TaxID=2851888 RepID=UPI001C393806|nr:AMP-binding protein [Streptomyces corallincola]MBV2357596.1 AMP-binding protein [Streptomyces corallincola]